MKTAAFSRSTCWTLLDDDDGFSEQYRQAISPQSWTSIKQVAIRNPLIRERIETYAALNQFDDLIVRAVPTKIAPKVSDRHASDVISELSFEFNLPISRLLMAAKIRPRTYYSWLNKPKSQPRIASQGRLWSLIQLIDQLRDLVDLNVWFIDEHRMEMLEKGLFRELLDEAANSTRPGSNPTAWADSYTGDDEILVDIPRSSTRPIGRKAKKGIRRSNL